MITDQEIDYLIQGNRYPGTLQGARNFARAIEQAATAPLLAQIAALERSIARARTVRRRAVATLYKRALDAEAKLAEKDALAQSAINPSST